VTDDYVLLIVQFVGSNTAQSLVSFPSETSMCDISSTYCTVWQFTINRTVMV